MGTATAPPLRCCGRTHDGRRDPTDRLSTAAFDDGWQTLEDSFASLPPLQRLGEPEDIANVVAFLAGPESGWINGQILRANGGIA